MGTLLLTILGTVLAAAIIGTWKWLAKADNRETARAVLRQRFCRHQWEPIPNELITPDYEWCVKCGARR